MHGNVWEWCLDAMSKYPDAEVADPLVSAGAERVYRGGSWINKAVSCRSAFRKSASPSSQYSVVGFRVVLAPVVAV
jgi:formylglycine-generating enzyme required for sulfatase activity